MSSIGFSRLARKLGILGTRGPEAWDAWDTWEKLPSLETGEGRKGDLALALAGDPCGVL